MGPEDACATVHRVVDRSLLAGVALFEGLADDALRVVADSGTSRHLERGDLLFRQGEPADELFVVVSGRIAIATRSIDGRESMVALMEAGDLFGELSFFDGRGRSTDARALEPSEVLAFPFAPLRAALDAQPDALWHVVELLAGRLRTTDEALADSVFLDVPGRTAKRLLELAGDADEFQLPLTQEELAGLVGASRERVNKAIAQFIRLGWIDQQERRYKIRDREQLSRRSR
jgi:CRP-like cAMP-binding protein